MKVFIVAQEVAQDVAHDVAKEVAQDVAQDTAQLRMGRRAAMSGAAPCLSTDLTTRAVPHFMQALQIGRRAAPSSRLR